jgi:hypothetical protein
MALMNPKPKILFLISEDWYFRSHRLPLARPDRPSISSVVIVDVGDVAGKVVRGQVESAGKSLQRVRGESPPHGLRPSKLSPPFTIKFASNPQLSEFFDSDISSCWDDQFQ